MNGIHLQKEKYGSSTISYQTAKIKDQTQDITFKNIDHLQYGYTCTMVVAIGWGGGGRMKRKLQWQRREEKRRETINNNVINYYYDDEIDKG